MVLWALRRRGGVFSRRARARRGLRAAPGPSPPPGTGRVLRPGARDSSAPLRAASCQEAKKRGELRADARERLVDAALGGGLERVLEAAMGEAGHSAGSPKEPDRARPARASKAGRARVCHREGRVLPESPGWGGSGEVCLGGSIRGVGYIRPKSACRHLVGSVLAELGFSLFS